MSVPREVTIVDSYASTLRVVSLAPVNLASRWPLTAALVMVSSADRVLG